MRSLGLCPSGEAAVRAAAALTLLLALAACAQGEIHRIPRQPHPTFSHVSNLPRSQREAEMNRQWQNQPLAALMDAYGRPKLVINIPGGGMPPSFAVVYGTDPTTGCIDAFAVSAGSQPVVRIYHCR
ncbi:hypothetical protein [Ramlibacter alkalitolerans]|uniref:Lipoprotein n=1 Tax=Ramlibacter alkalitolerans TaxID=2039631 RepID=A0ABS1JNY6_9BURK|nr:hypothetical protein [Ramlibacter alkalitolerans]MBL0425968.1 hypothetical protein [Ramlibacter alkalitolerans]